MMRLFALVLVLFGTSVPVQAADVSVTIVEYGQYTADTKSEKLAADGIVDSVIENLSATTRRPRACR